MMSKKSLAVAALVALAACSCSDSRTTHDLGASVACIREYADSFKGLSAEAARNKLSGAKITEEDWKEGEFSGRQLVATFPEYEVRVLFLGDRVITTSFQVLSK
jgi:hypothetical protein